MSLTGRMLVVALAMAAVALAADVQNGASTAVPAPVTTAATAASTAAAPTTKATDAPTTTTTTVAKTTETTASASVSVATTTAPFNSEVGELSAGFLAGGWIPFTVVMVVSLVFSIGYVRFYQHTSERECGSTTVAVLGLAVALLTGALIPVDIFLVSTLKEHDGAYKSWATSPSVRDDLKHIVTYAYYAMYALNELFVFLLLPLAYFYFEEKDEEAGTTRCRRFFNACKYTLGFVIVFGVLTCIGAFAIGSDGAGCPETNTTDAKDWIQCRAQFAESALTKNGGTNALSFTIGSLTVIGFLYVILYTGYGMAALPIEMIRSRGRTPKDERRAADTQIRVAKGRQEDIRAKYAEKSRQMSGSDRSRLNQARESERILGRAASRLDAIENGCCGKIATILRPFEFIFGIFFFLLGIFLVGSLLATSLDKLLQITSQHLDFKTGYSHVTPRLINPVDKLFTLMQKAFPLDYIAMTGLVYYFIACTMAGIRALEVRLCCLRLYKVRAQRTAPQGLLFTCLILMFSILTLNVLLLTLMPTYISYGNQKFSAVDIPTNSTCMASKANYFDDLSLCSYQAPQYQYFITYSPTDAPTTQRTAQINGVGIESLFDGTTHNRCAEGVVFTFCNNTAGLPASLPASSVTCSVLQEPCTQTRLAALLNAFFYNLWFFGAIYYWSNYGIILVFTIAIVVLTCRRRKSLMQSLINDQREDFDDSDDDMVPFNPSWKA